MSNEIRLQLTLEEVNLILEAVGNLPFARVYSLVTKIQAQASEQLPRPTPPAGSSPTPGGPNSTSPAGT